ncbi:peptidoglycan recognition protein [Streptomyces sp. NRRL S-87]|uniref:peptidoglycan recognition protein family protein n=1 Tax=Streptomyces sp. NRRL S-87 TaxID=1463920 RepID=UPI0004BFBD41|nr:peptidoglycan recognition protein [Streptomyces sp. NRRL S-87]
MRGYLASSIGVATAAALALPLALPSQALAVTVTAGGTAARTADRAAAPGVVAESAVPGSTQSLPLVPLTPASARAGRVPGMAARLPGAQLRGLAAREVKTFALVGLVWDDAATELHGRVQVRTRSAATAAWTDWQDLETHNREHAADPGTAEDTSGRVKGSTAPLWVGESDGIEVRVQAEPGEAPPEEAAPDGRAGPVGPEAAGAAGTRAAVPDGGAQAVQSLPEGMRIELVDPGRTAAAPPHAESAGAAGAADGKNGGRHDGTRTGPDRTHADPNGDRTHARPNGDGTHGDGRHHGSGRHGAGGTSSAGTDEGHPIGAAQPLDKGPRGESPKDESPEEESPEDEAPEDEKSTLQLAPAVAESSAANSGLAPLGADEIEALDKADSTADAVIAHDGKVSLAAKPYIGPRPRIVTRKGWGADESLREKGFVYTGTVKAAFVHHSASGNNYTCAQAPAVLRSLYRYHVLSSGWRDFGYNFAVDKCGTVYEGRAGGVAKPVMGAHTMGFNTNSMGIAVLGTFTDTNPPDAAVKAVARLTAWKLGLFGANPLATTTLKSGGGNKFAKGKLVKMNVISGHRDGFATECPGRKLYSKLGTTRQTSARYQGR